MSEFLRKSFIEVEAVRHEYWVKIISILGKDEIMVEWNNRFVIDAKIGYEIIEVRQERVGVLFDGGGLLVRNYIKYPDRVNKSSVIKSLREID